MTSSVSRVSLAFLALAGCSSEPAPPEDPADPAPDATIDDRPAPRIPTPTGTCPAITNGDVTFAPAGMAPRTVKLALDPAATTPGPLVLYWHATGSGMFESAYALGATHDELVAAGGVVATPASDPAAGSFEWFVVNGSSATDDFRLADEIVACLVAVDRIDERRVHSIGMSAGALQTTALGFARSSYLASVATYSGGMPPGFAPVTEAPANKYAALIFAGGAGDAVFGVDFAAASATYRATLAAAGHFAALCDHGTGHEIPLDAAPSVATFFAAHPFGAPSPYLGAGLPTTFPTYCAR